MIKRMLQALVLQHCFLRKFFQLFTGGCQLNSAVIPQKQRMPERFFQPLDLP